MSSMNYYGCWINADLSDIKLTKSYTTQTGSGIGSAYAIAGHTMYAINKTYKVQVGDLILAYSTFTNNMPATAQIVSGAIGIGVSGEFMSDATLEGGAVGYCTSTSVTIRHMWMTQGNNVYGAYIIHTDISR